MERLSLAVRNSSPMKHFPAPVSYIHSRSTSSVLRLWRLTEAAMACKGSQHRRVRGSAGKSEIMLRCNCTARTLAFVAAVSSILLQLSVSWIERNVGSIFFSLYDLHAQRLVAAPLRPKSLPMVPFVCFFIQGRSFVYRSHGSGGSECT